MKKEIIWSHESEPLKYRPDEGSFKKEKDVDKEKELDEEYEAEGKINLRKIVQTSIGNFLLDDELNPINNLHFWRGDCSFDITNKVQKIIEQTPGVDILKILTRYAFVIAVGKAFTFHDVRLSIEEQLCGPKTPSNKEEEELVLLKKELKTYPAWTIYQFPNGSLDFVYLEQDKSNSKEYEEKVKLFQEAKELSNGNLIKNE